MLTFFRNQKNKKAIYWVLALIVIPSFLITGVVLWSPGEQAPTSLGKVGKRSVSVQEYLGAYKAVQHHAAMIYGEEFTRIRRQINWKSEAWDRILLLEHAKKEGIRIGDKEVVDWLQNQQVFRRGDAFDLELYKRFVAEMIGESTRRFEEEVRQILTIRKLTEGVRGGVKIDDEELKDLYARRRGSRDLAYAVVASDTKTPAAEIKDEEIVQAYEIVKDKLTTPVRVNLQYAFVPAAEKDSKKAALEDGGSLAEITQKHKLVLAETGAFSANERVPDALAGADTALAQGFSLAEGAESAWVETPKGFFKMKSLQREAERTLSPEESKEMLKSLLVRDKARESAMKTLRDLKTVIDEKGFEKALAEAKIEVRTFPSYDPSKTVPGLDAPVLPRVATALKAGETSEPFETTGGAAIVKILKDAPLDAALFEQEKSSFRNEALEEKTAAAMDALLGDLRKNLKVDVETMEKIFPRT